jgi:hypothetical protein
LQCAAEQAHSFQEINMEVQTDFGARGRVPEMLCYSVDGLLSAELNPSLIQHADICLAVIEQRFVSAPAWLRVDSMSFNASTPQDIASAMLERASASTDDLYLQCEGADEFIAHQYAPQGLAHGSLFLDGVQVHGDVLLQENVS